MASVPISVLRSVMILKESAKTYTVSTVFIVKFNDGSEKRLHRIDKVAKDLVKMCEVGIDNIKVLSNTESPLYFKDWANVREYKNNFRKEYPKPILPDFVEEYIGINNI